MERQSTWETETKSARTESKATMVYRVSSRTVRAVSIYVYRETLS